MTAVTVAIPVFNGARFLRHTIDSLLSQTYRDFVLLVIDDLSTDDSFSIASSYGDDRLRVLRNGSRRGLAGNWNEALARTATPMLVIAHQDDVYEPEFLARSLTMLALHPRAFVAHSRAQYIDEQDRPLESAASRFKDRFWPPEEPYERDPTDELRLLQEGNYIICPSAMYRMSAVAEIGMFNERYRFVPDWEYWMRGVMKGFTIVGSHAQLVRWRRHDATTTKQEETTLRRYDEELELLRWIASTAGLPLNLRALENNLLSEFAARLAGGDRAAAAALQTYASARLPDARRIRTLMALGLFGGRAGGRLMRSAERVWAHVAPRLS